MIYVFYAPLFDVRNDEIRKKAAPNGTALANISTLYYFKPQ